MPPAPRVTTQAIVNALLEWRGNITRTASALGIAPNSLYERIRRLGIDLEGFRRLDPSIPVIPMTGITPVIGMTGIRGNDSSLMHAQKNAAAIFPRSGGGRRLGAVQQTVAVKDEPAIPIRTVPARRKPPRLTPDNEDRLAAFQRQVEARYGVDTDITALLNQLFEETFDHWAQGKLEPLPEQQPRRRKNGPKEAAE